jgi:hypothetical protein
MWFPNINQPNINMLLQPEKVSLLARMRERGLSGAFLGLALLAMAGWVYLLSSIFLKFVLWCLSWGSEGALDRYELIIPAAANLHNNLHNDFFIWRIFQRRESWCRHN